MTAWGSPEEGTEAKLVTLTNVNAGVGGGCKVCHKCQGTPGACVSAYNQDTPTRREARLSCQRRYLISGGENWPQVPTMHSARPTPLSARSGSRQAPGPLREAPSVLGDPFCSFTSDTHTAADSQPQRGSEDQGTSLSSLFNFGKTQCSLHSNVAKWCHDPLALGSPIQRGTSHTALPLPTAWFCV